MLPFLAAAAAQPVFIGPMELTGLEVPERFDRGGSMQPAIHRLIGGGRVVQLMGSEPRTRELRGILTGPDAVERAITLEALRDGGEVVPLNIGAWSELVVVTALTVRYASQGNVLHYRLQAEALPPDAGEQGATVGNVVQGAIEDLAQAIGHATEAGDGAITAALGASLASFRAEAAGTDTPFLPTDGPSSLLAATIGSAGAVLAPSGGAVVAAPADLLACTGAARRLAGAVQAGAYLNRATRSVGALSGRDELPSIHA